MTEAVREKPGITILYRLFYALILGLAVYGCVSSAYAFQGKLFVHVFVMIFGLVLLLLLDCFIGRAAFCVTGAFLAIAAVYHVRFKPVDMTGLTEEQEKAMFSPGNVRELWFVCLIMIAALAAWSLLEGFIVLKAVSAAAAVVFLIICMIMGNGLPRMSVCTALLYVASNILELLEVYWEKKGNKNKKAYFVGIIPFLILYFVLTAVMPVRKTPYDWAFARNIYRQMQERVYVLVQNISLGVGEDFGISTTGFSDDAGFFSDLADHKKEVIHLKKNASFDSAVYLTGKTYDTFDGRTWENTFEMSRKDVVMDTLETFYAVYQYDGDHRRDYIRKLELDVEYRFFHTKYLFTPLKTIEITGFDQGKDYEADEGWYKFHRRKNFSTQYKSAYYVMNRRHPDFVRMIEAVSGAQMGVDGGSSYTADESDDPASEKIWNRVLKKQDMVSGVLRYEDLENYRKRMGGYKMVPKVSSKTWEWLQTVCEGAASDYEKMVRIEEALSSFSYNVRPGKLPGYVDSEKDFLDYFLFEKREGYCSYFATSFVLLARAAGMPARLAEGYCVREMDSGTKQGSALECDVMSGMAHAWPEVYFEGVGWIPFEPTPGFGKFRNTVWKTSSDIAAEEVLTAETEEGTIADFHSEYKEDDEAAEEIILPEEDPFVYDFALFILLLTVGAIGLFILFVILDAVREKVQTAGMDAESRFKRSFRRNMQILDAMGCRREENETLAEFNSRLPEEESFIKTYEIVFYGDGQVDESLVESMSEARRKLLRNLKSKKGASYYFVKCLLYLRRVR